MLAVLMGNAGGAWDNSKKLCEKLKIKKTDQGKACVVGDTVGDPFKDTSGPSLDILLKLMSMVALLIAPLMAGKDDYEDWWIGLIPSVLLLGSTAVLIYLGILSWKDPLAEADLGEQRTQVKPMGESQPPAEANKVKPLSSLEEERVSTDMIKKDPESNGNGPRQGGKGDGPSSPSSLA